jgi:hypothetical protein
MCDIVDKRLISFSFSTDKEQEEYFIQSCDAKSPTCSAFVERGQPTRSRGTAGSKYMKGSGLKQCSECPPALSMTSRAFLGYAMPTSWNNAERKVECSCCLTVRNAFHAALCHGVEWIIPGLIFISAE